MTTRPLSTGVTGTTIIENFPPLQNSSDACSMGVACSNGTHFDRLFPGKTMSASYCGALPQAVFLILFKLFICVYSVVCDMHSLEAPINEARRISVIGWGWIVRKRHLIYHLIFMDFSFSVVNSQLPS